MVATASADTETGLQTAQVQKGKLHVAQPVEQKGGSYAAAFRKVERRFVTGLNVTWFHPGGNPFPLLPQPIFCPAFPENV